MPTALVNYHVEFRIYIQCVNIIYIICSYLLYYIALYYIEEL